MENTSKKSDVATSDMHFFCNVCLFKRFGGNPIVQNMTSIHPFYRLNLIHSIDFCIRNLMFILEGKYLSPSVQLIITNLIC